jgi:hypothetical protein
VPPPPGARPNSLLIFGPRPFDVRARAAEARSEERPEPTFVGEDAPQDRNEGGRDAAASGRWEKINGLLTACAPDTSPKRRSRLRFSVTRTSPACAKPASGEGEVKSSCGGARRSGGPREIDTRRNKMRNVLPGPAETALVNGRLDEQKGVTMAEARAVPSCASGGARFDRNKRALRARSVAVTCQPRREFAIPYSVMVGARAGKVGAEGGRGAAGLAARRGAL